MKRSSLFYVGLFAMLFTGACSTDDSVTNANEQRNVDGRVLGMVHGVVTDAANNAQLPGVVVMTAVNGQVVTTTTNAGGYYAFSNLPSGDYVITFDFQERAGKVIADAYAVGRVYEEIPMLEDIGIVDQPNSRDFPYSVERNVSLYPLVAGMTGKVFKSPDPEHAGPAGAVTVIADFSNYDLSEDQYTTTTDATGNYVFTSLPATYSVQVRTLPFNDGEHSFGGGWTWTTIYLAAGASVVADNIVVGITGGTPIIVANNFRADNVGLTDNLELTFSEPMQTETFVAELYGPWGAVDTENTWTSDGLNLVINPYASLRAGEDYQLHLAGLSQQLITFNDNPTFGTVPAIQLGHTNLELVDGQMVNFPVDGNIEVTYTEAVDLTLIGTSINLSVNGNPVAIATSLMTGNNKTVVINPDHRLELGTSYSLSMTIYGAGNMGSATNSWSFSTVYNTTLPAPVANFTLNVPDFKADWNTTSMAFKWDTLPGVTGYRIYARNTAAKSDYLLVLTVPANQAVSTQTGTVNIASAPFNGIFDVYAGDGIQTPFTNNIDMVFKVAAYNAVGQGPFSAEFRLSDDMQPTYTFGALAGSPAGSSTSFNNNTGAERVITLPLLFSEYLASNISVVFNVTQGTNVGNAVYLLPNTQMSIVMNANRRDCTLTFRIPQNSDARADRLVITGINDNSGNSVTVVYDIPNS